MHKKLARLVTWLAEMLDRNRSWFPKSANLKPPRRPLGRSCNHCAFRSPSALTQRTRQTHARAIWSAFTGFESWRRSCAMRCIKRCVTQLTSAASLVQMPRI